MYHMQKMMMICIAGILAGCSAMSTGWAPSQKQSGNTTFEHFACAADGMGQVIMGALQGTLDGTARVLEHTSQIGADQTSDAQADEIILAIFGTGAVLGFGVGFRERILDLPASYQDCLDRQEALRQKITI